MVLDQDDLKYNYGCSSCGYKPQNDGPLGRIPLDRVIETLDAHFNKNDLPGAGKLLDYWRCEAVSLRDYQGELSIVNEQLGYFRKTGDSEKADEAVSRSLQLIEALGNADSVSAATVYLNAATTLKAFGKAEDALPLYQQALAVYRTQLDPTDTRFGGFYNNYGLALADLNRFEEAEQAFRSALAVMSQSANGKPEEAITHLNLAHLFESWSEKDSSAIDTSLDCAESLLKDPGIPQNGYFAFVLSKCAPSYRHFGREETAVWMEQLSEELYERS